MRCRPPCLGTAGPIDIIQDLGRRGSLFITRPPIMQHVAKLADLEWTARDFFQSDRKWLRAFIWKNFH